MSLSQAEEPGMEQATSGHDNDGISDSFEMISLSLSEISSGAACVERSQTVTAAGNTGTSSGQHMASADWQAPADDGTYSGVFTQLETKSGAPLGQNSPADDEAYSGVFTQLVSDSHLLPLNETELDVVHEDCEMQSRSFTHLPSNTSRIIQKHRVHTESPDDEQFSGVFTQLMSDSQALHGQKAAEDAENYSGIFTQLASDSQLLQGKKSDWQAPADDGTYSGVFTQLKTKSGALLGQNSPADDGTYSGVFIQLVSDSHLLRHNETELDVVHEDCEMQSRNFTHLPSNTSRIIQKHRVHTESPDDEQFSGVFTQLMSDSQALHGQKAAEDAENYSGIFTQLASDSQLLQGKKSDLETLEENSTMFSGSFTTLTSQSVDHGGRNVAKTLNDTGAAEDDKLYSRAFTQLSSPSQQGQKTDLETLVENSTMFSGIFTTLTSQSAEDGAFRAPRRQGEAPHRQGEAPHCQGEDPHSQKEASVICQVTCPVCLEEATDPVKTSCCKHIFCTSCLDRCFERRAQCPNCGEVVGPKFGDQPEGGTMAMLYTKPPGLPGFKSTGYYTIHYSLPAGTQGSYHPSPGKAYEATERTAYLPDTEDGRRVMMMLKVAFDRGLVFTVGESLTTGIEGIVWSTLMHHKTSITGGQEEFGYPDLDYLSRVQTELKDKARVTEVDLAENQKVFIQNPEQYFIEPYKDFSAYFSTDL